MSIYVLDADGNGMDSIQHLVDSQKVTVLDCSTFEQFDNHCRSLLTKVSADDIVILDTVTSMANSTRGDAKLGTDSSESLWNKREKFLSDKAYLTVYELAGQLIMRRLKNLRARNAHIIVTAHEDEQRDDGSQLKKRAPAVNQALFRSLMGASSDVLRLMILNDPVLDAKGNVRVPAGTRALQLKVDDEAVIKTHVRREVSEKLPAFIYAPTWAKMLKALDKTPSFLVLYGLPGVGKTSLATDSATPHTQQETK